MVCTFNKKYTYVFPKEIIEVGRVFHRYIVRGKNKCLNASIFVKYVFFF